MKPLRNWCLTLTSASKITRSSNRVWNRPNKWRHCCPWKTWEDYQTGYVTSRLLQKQTSRSLGGLFKHWSAGRQIQFCLVYVANKTSICKGPCRSTVGCITMWGQAAHRWTAGWTDDWKTRVSPLVRHFATRNAPKFILMDGARPQIHKNAPASIRFAQDATAFHLPFRLLPPVPCWVF